MPRVSVIMSAHNEERYVRSAIDSILRQTFGDFEFVVIDDGSVDRTAEILKGYQDPRVRVYHQANQGQSVALNRGIRLASGSFIARMDADDVALPQRLEKEVAFLDGHPEIGLVGTWCVKVDSITGQERLHPLPEEDGAIRKFMTVDNPFIHSSVMIRKSVLDRVGLYDEGLIWQDYDLWVRIARHYRMANIPDPLIIRRKHPTSISGREKKSRQSWERFRIQWKAALHIGLAGRGVAAMTKSLANTAWYRVLGR